MARSRIYRHYICAACGARLSRHIQTKGSALCGHCAQLANNNRNGVGRYSTGGIPGGYYSVVDAPCGPYDPLRIMTAPELYAALRADLIPIGATVERQDGARLVVAYAGGWRLQGVA